MKSILDPLFRYRPSFATDVRDTFERIRREKKAAPDAIPATSAEQSISDFALALQSGFCSREMRSSTNHGVDARGGRSRQDVMSVGSVLSAGEQYFCRVGRQTLAPSARKPMLAADIHNSCAVTEASNKFLTQRSPR
jgi:hypothetical protein